MFKKLYRRPWLIIAVIAVITVFFIWELPKAELENNNLRFVPHDDPALETSRWIDDMFGSSFFILIGLERPYGTIFDREFIECIQEYTRAIEDIPIVKDVTSIISADYITSADDAIVVEKIIGKNFSGSAEEIAGLKQRLLSWDMYERALYSDDFRATQILIPLTIGSEEASSRVTTEQFLRIRDLAHKVFDGNASVYVTGMPVITATVNEAMNADLKLLVPLVILVILLLLFFSFREFTPVVLPMLTVVISVIWAIGAMPLFSVKMSVISTVLPVILVAIGSSYGIHLVIHYIAKRGVNDVSREEHSELVIAAITSIHKPVFLAALTTIVGFCSLCITSVIPIREFGFFAVFGVACAYAVTVALIPALLIVRGPRPVKIYNANNTAGFDFSVFVANKLFIIGRQKKIILFLSVIVIAFALYGISKLIIDNVMVEYFRKDTDIYRSDEFIRRQFGGSKVVSVVVSSGDENAPEIILRPDTLAAMDGLSVYLQKNVPNVGKVMGFTDLIKRINQVFNADESPLGLNPVNGIAGSDDYGSDDFGFSDFGFGDFDKEKPAAEPDAAGTAGSNIAESGTNKTDNDRIFTQKELLLLFDRAGSSFRGMNANDLIRELKKQVNYEGASYFEIPVDPKRYGKETPSELQKLIANYLILLSGNIKEYANDPLEPSAVKATVQLRTLGMDDSDKIFGEIERYTAANFPGDVTVTVGGTTMVEKSLNNLVVQSQIISMLFTVLCLFTIIAIANKSPAAGFISIAPLSISILLNFAVMGLMGIKLNLGTAMVAAVSLAVGIDFTIHCLEAFKREYKAADHSKRNSGEFVRNVYLSSGKAIIIDAVSDGLGFAVLALSSFTILQDFGMLIAFTMLSSAVVSLTVLPALLTIIKPKFIYG